MHQDIRLCALQCRVTIRVIVRFSKQNWNEPLISVYTETWSDGLWAPIVTHVPYVDHDEFVRLVQDSLEGFQGALEARD